MFFRTHRATAKRLQPRNGRPVLEVLEDRVLLAIRWVNVAGGEWSEPNNWDLRRLPGLSDDAIIDIPNITVTHSRDSDVIHSFTSRNRTIISGGSSLELRGGNSRIDDYLRIDVGSSLISTYSGISGDGSIENLEQLHLNYSTLNLTYVNRGTTEVQGNSAINGRFTIQAGSVVRVLGTDQNGDARLFCQATVDNLGEIKLDSTANRAARLQTFLVHNFNNARITSGSGGGAREVAGQVQNDNGGTIDINQPTTVSGNLTNNGALNLNADLVVAGDLTNAATGRISVPQGGSPGRRIQVENIENSGEYRSSVVTTMYVHFLGRNAGTMQFDGPGTIQLAAGANFSSTRTATLTIAGQQFIISQGASTLDGTLRIASGSTVDLTGTTLTNYANGTLSGGTYIIGGTLLANIGDISTNNASLTLDGPDARFVNQLYHDLLQRTSDNEGFMTLLNGSTFNPAGNFTNNGSFTVGPTSRVNVFAVWVTVGFFDVQPGGIVHLGQGGRIAGTYSNSGRIELDAGANLSLEGSGSSSGLFDLSDGSWLNFNSGNHHLNNGATISGPGRARSLSDSVLFIGGRVVVRFLDFQGESVQEPGSEWIMIDSFHWGATQSGSQIHGGGTVTLPPGSQSTMDGTGPKVLDGIRINLGGTLTTTGPMTVRGGGGIDASPLAQWFAYDAQFQGGVYTAAGNLTTDGNVTIDGSVTNSGNFTVRTGQTSITNFRQTDGFTFVHRDRALVSPVELLHLDGGVLGGTGLVDASVVNSGTIRPGSDSDIGDLQITRLIDTPSATLMFKCAGAAPGSCDRILAGSASLDGTLALRLTNGYQPAAGDRLDLLLANSVDGTFAGFDLDDPGSGQHWQPDIGTDHVSLSVEPDPSTPQRGPYLESRPAIAPATVPSRAGEPSAVPTQGRALSDAFFARHAAYHPSTDRGTWLNYEREVLSWGVA